MKTSPLYRYSLALITCTFALILFPSPASATVGGPTYIGSFMYNNANESIYYIERSDGGRGCPPELKKVSLVSEKIDTVFSCSQGESLQGNDYTNNYQLAMVEITKLTNGFKDLTPVSLTKNTIRIDVDFVKTETLDSEPDWILKTHFLAKVYQNNKKIDEFQIAGCNLDQPFTFAGYAIPGFEKKIALLSSTKGNCFEGGYTIERLSIIGGVNVQDGTHTGGYKSIETPLVPSESTLVVFEHDTVDFTASSTVPTKNTSSTTTLILLTFIGLVVGFLIRKSTSK